MKLLTIILVIAAFAAGYLVNGTTATFATANYDGGYELPAQIYGDVTGQAIARTTPGDHVAEEQIRVYKDRVVLDLKDAVWAQFTPTHSMDPVLSDTANALEVVPKSASEVNEGDIIAYRSQYADGIIIHRVIKKGSDQLGPYFIVKGDNNPKADPGIVRFEDIKSVVVGIIY